MSKGHIILLSAVFAICTSQRSPYAGRLPIGFPIIVTTTPSTVLNSTLGNRFGESNITTTTQRLPVEALGDRDLFNRLGQLPQDKQPFWFINWQALEQHRQQAHSYPQRPSSFAERVPIPVQNVQANQIEPVNGAVA